MPGHDDELIIYRLLLATSRLQGDDFVRRDLVLPSRVTPVTGCYARVLDQLQVDFARALQDDSQRPRTAEPLAVPAPQDEHAAMFSRSMGEPDPALTLDIFNRHRTYQSAAVRIMLKKVTSILLSRSIAPTSDRHEENLQDLDAYSQIRALVNQLEGQ